MKILVVSATVFEMAPFTQYLEQKSKKVNFWEFATDKHTIFPLVSGVGIHNTVYALSKSQRMAEIDVVLNIGVCGSFDRSIALGTVVEVVKDRFGDLGVEEANGTFTDVHEMELIDENYFPYQQGWIINDKMKFNLGLPHKNGITVNKVHGSAQSIEHIKSKYNADIESMEGAAFTFCCKMLDVKHHQIRAISNYVEPRNRAAWQLELAIDKLNKALIDLVES